MSRLRDRVARQPAAARAAAAGYHPHGTADTPMVMPMVKVTYSPAGMTVQQVITAPDGRMIPATAPGRFGQVCMAGRP